MRSNCKAVINNKQLATYIYIVDIEFVLEP